MSAALLLAVLAGLSPQEPPARVERRLEAMGTLLALEVTAPTRSEALAASERAVRALEEVEARLSTWRPDTELARLNATPVDVDFQTSPELERDLERAAHWWRATDGAFDPGVGALVQAWGLRSGGRQPAPEELRAARAASGFALFERADGTVRRRRAGATIEEGGFGKGLALDAALAALSGTSASEATLDLGGQVAVHGTGSFRYALADPRDRERAVLELTLESGSIATSGNSERGIVVGGRPASHLLDPRTGSPAPDFGSLTVWAQDATAADCLSTGLYVLGPEAALAWAAANEGVEVLVLEVEEGRLRVRVSAGASERASPLAEDVAVEVWGEAPARAGEKEGDS